MRKAGALTAEALDLLGPLVKPGVTTAALDKFVFEFARDHGAYPAPLNYRGYRKSICTSINHVVCHGVPDDKPLRDGDILNIDVTLIVDGLARRREPHVRRRRAASAGAAADRRHLRGADARRRRDQAGRDHRRHRPRHPDLRRRRALLGGARLLRPRPRPAVPRRAEHPPRRAQGGGRAAQGRHVLHRRADDQPRRLRREDPVGRLDRGDPRPIAVGAIRAHGRRDRDRVRDLHALADGRRSRAHP